ncbi:MAG: hypothetical protein QM790_16940 [Nibricoccus sp.]
MNSADKSEISVQTLLALRQESDALRIITEKLRVKEMGPADHIRTKHEVKAFVESGDIKAAHALIKLAQLRVSPTEDSRERLTQQQTSRQKQGV